MLTQGGKKIPLAIYKLKTYLDVFWLTFQPKKWLFFILTVLSLHVYQASTKTWVPVTYSVMGKLGNEAP